ncbi:MAG: hypothetical protein C4521_01195 [Actinobacteria bacterium]|nr:MAG: hypothetical protein C4521_01195 [Actinomycetota bacterium]
MMRPFKIVVAGPGKAEKTTFIKTVCDITVVSAGRGKSDGLQRGKAGDKPVAMDVGRINVSKDMALYLFGCAPRQRFDLLADTFAEGLLGLLVVLPSDDREATKEAAGVLSYFESFGDLPRVVVAHDLPPESEAELREELEVDGEVPIVFCDVADKASAKKALSQLLRLSRSILSGDTG